MYLECPAFKRYNVFQWKEKGNICIYHTHGASEKFGHTVLEEKNIE